VQLCRRRFIAVVLLAASLPRVSLAMFARYSDEELISRSDLIVMGEWMGQAAVGRAALGGSAPFQDLGAVTITEVLKGSTAQTVALVATPSTNGLRTGSDIRHKRGDTGMWLLRAKPSAPIGIYLADHPQRFEADAARIDALLRLLKR
jgi:hypothetical protein